MSNVALAPRGLLDHHRDSTGSCRLLAAGSPQFRRLSGFSFSGVQMLSRGAGKLDGNGLDVAGEAVERRAQAQVLAQPLVAAGLAQTRDRLVEVVVERSSTCSRTTSLDLVVRDGDAGPGRQPPRARPRARRTARPRRAASRRAARGVRPLSERYCSSESRRARHCARSRSAVRACAPRRAARPP